MAKWNITLEEEDMQLLLLADRVVYSGQCFVAIVIDRLTMILFGAEKRGVGGG